MTRIVYGIDFAFSDLHTKSPVVLTDLGMRPWNDPEDTEEPQIFDGKVLWLFPATWYDLIPVGFEVVNIMGRRSRFGAESSDDQRAGMLAYGVLCEPWKGSQS